MQTPLVIQQFFKDFTGAFQVWFLTNKKNVKSLNKESLYTCV